MNNKKMITVLVTGSGGGVGQGIIKSLKLISDLKIKIISADMSPLAAGVYSGDVSVIIPSASSVTYFDSLIQIINEEKVDYYFPGTDVELLFCAEQKANIEASCNVKVVISPLEAIKISDDKFKTMEFLKYNGFNYPETILAEQCSQSSFKYPVIVKPAIGCRSIGVGIAYSEEEVLKRISKESGLVVQELIGDDSTEFTCTIVIVNDFVSDVVILRRDLRSGDTFRAEPISNKAISDYVKSVAIKLGIYGSCNFQLRLDANQQPKIFEINCRFSGTTPFCAQLGLNPVEYYLKSDLNITYDFKIDFNVYILRYWSEVLVNKEDMDMLAENKKITPKVLANAPLYSSEGF